MSLTTPPALPDWGTAIAGGDIATPDAGTRASGWVKTGGVPPKPPYQWMNWFMVLTYDMLKWCRDSILDLAGAQLVPVGTISAFAGAAAPTGFLLCNGSAVSQTTYASLYALIGTTYGTDTGGNFTLPDLRGAVPVGYKSGDTGTVNFATLGSTVGAKTHALSSAELASHSHDVKQYTGITNPTPSVTCSSTGIGDILTDTVATSSTGSGTAHNNVQPSLVINYVIKY